MKNNTVTQQQVDDLYNNSTRHIQTLWNKCTVMAIKLPNGFVIVESSSCVDENNYSSKLGMEICEEKIKNKIWELLGYSLQDRLGGL